MALTQITSNGIKDDEVKNSDMADDSVGIAELSATGTASNTTYLRGDNTWSTPPDNDTTYTHPNHTGEVTSAGDGATTITDDVVDEANLKISNAGSNGQFLQKQSGNTGGLTWATPDQVGGGTGTDYDDNVKVRWGTDKDLEIYHDGNHSRIVDVGQGILSIQGSGVDITNTNASENMITCVVDAEVKLYYNGAEKLATTDTGVLVTGNAKIGDAGKFIAGDGDDIQIHHNTNSFIQNSTGYLGIQSDTLYLQDKTNGHAYITCLVDGAVGIRYDNDEKLATTSDGVDIIGDVHLTADNNKLKLGAAGTGDLQIYHDGTDNIINAVNGNIKIFVNDGEEAIVCNANGSVDLYHDDSKMLETNAQGVIVGGDVDNATGTQGVAIQTGGKIRSRVANTSADAFIVSIDGSGASNVIINGAGNGLFNGGLDVPDDVKIQLGGGDDLQIYHDATNTLNFIDAINGNLRIRVDNGENAIQCVAGGAVELYHNNNKKFETTANGCKLADGVLMEFGDNGEFTLDHGANTNTHIKHTGAGDMYIQSVNDILLRNNTTADKYAHFKEDAQVELYYNNIRTFFTDPNGAVVIGPEGGSGNLYLYGDEGDDNNDKFAFVAFAGELSIQNYTSGSWENNIKCNGDGGVELFYDNSLKIETASDKVMFSAHAKVSTDNIYDLGAAGARWRDLYLGGAIFQNDDDPHYFGNGNDLALYHDGTHSWMTNATGTLVIETNRLDIRTVNNEHYIEAEDGGEVALFYDNAKKLNTNSGGVKVHGDLQFDDSDKIEMGGGDDLKIYHNGTNSLIHNSTGNLFVQGGGGTVYLQAVDDENGVKINPNGAVELYHNDAKKLETQSDGVRITDNLYATEIYDNTTSGGANVRVQSSGLLQRDTSSRRYKNSIKDATHGLADLNKLRPVTYKGNNDGDTIFGGLIAEEVHDAGLTEFVDYDNTGQPDALKYGNMVSLCIKAIQELSAEVDTLKTKVAALESA